MPKRSKHSFYGCLCGFYPFLYKILLQALDTRFSSATPADIKPQIQALKNKIMLKRLCRSAIQSKDIDDLRKSLEELTAEDPA